MEILYMFTLLRFGKLLEAGIALYKSKQYSRATQLTDEALAIDSRDFTANFWRARMAIAEKKNDLAKQHITICKEINNKLEKPLIEPLEILMKRYKINEYISDREFEKCDNEIDEKLEHYQHYREFNISDILKLLKYGVIWVILSVLLLYLNISSSREMLEFIFGSSFLVCLVAYYLRKPILPLNLWKQCTYILITCKELMKRKSFIILIASLFLAIKIMLYTAIHFGHYTKQLVPYSGIIIVMIAPIYEEVLYRGILYRFFKRYNRLLAYIVVSLLFFFMHEDANTIHFIASIILIWVYDKYKTLIAPIIIHSFCNLLLINYK